MVSQQAIDRIFSDAVASTAVPGLVAVAATDRGLVYEGAFGKRELGKDAPMTVDTVVWIASMTKAITATAAMQLVERGKLDLDRPAQDVVRELQTARVLVGFDDAGQPRLRPPARPITLRHLLTHTAGFSYEMWSAEIGRYQAAAGTPGIITCKNAALTTPLLFDPGDGWEYGISIDWVGKMVEAASGEKLDRYFREHIFGPLGMQDTSFKLAPSQRARLASVHQRGTDGALAPIQFGLPEEPEFHMGGGGLYATAGDYVAFCRMMLDDGRARDQQGLGPEAVAAVAHSQLE